MTKRFQNFTSDKRYKLVEKIFYKLGPFKVTDNVDINNIFLFDAASRSNCVLYTRYGKYRPYANVDVFNYTEKIIRGMFDDSKVSIVYPHYIFVNCNEEDINLMKLLLVDNLEYIDILYYQDIKREVGMCHP